MTRTGLRSGVSPGSAPATLSELVIVGITNRQCLSGLPTVRYLEGQLGLVVIGPPESLASSTLAGQIELHNGYNSQRSGCFALLLSISSRSGRGRLRCELRAPRNGPKRAIGPVRLPPGRAWSESSSSLSRPRITTYSISAVKHIYITASAQNAAVRGRSGDSRDV